MRRLLVLIGSSRRGGNTETLADAALEPLSGRLEVERVRLIDLRIDPVVDLRHAGRPFPPCHDDYDQVLFRLLDSDGVLFATPLYWYSMSGTMKNFIDRWTVSLRDPRFDFRARMLGKRAWVVCCGAGADPELAEPLFSTFRQICRYFGMDYQGQVLGRGNLPGEVLTDARALAAARQLIR